MIDDKSDTNDKRFSIRTYENLNVSRVDDNRLIKIVSFQALWKREPGRPLKR